MPTRTVLDAVLDLFSLSRCAACDLRIAPAQEPFCDGCAFVVEAVPPERRPPARHAALHAYGGPLADAITRAKYGADFVRVASLARLFDASAGLYAECIDVVVPVPLHANRLRERGFNVSAIFARRIASTLGLPARHLLERTRDTPAQAGLGASDRRSNVDGAFVAHGRAHGLRVLLVDDVRTTGATLSAARAALLRAGATEVRTLALAWADDASNL